MLRNKGFTLIELLIVLVLLGIITGTALLSMSLSDVRDKQKFEAERLVKLLDLASQEASVRGTPMGLEVFRMSYRFTVMQNNKWHPETGDMLFRARALMPQMQLALVKDQKSVSLVNQPAQILEPQPQIIVTPDGDMALFEIRLSVSNSDDIFRVSNTPSDGLMIHSESKL
ncbi:MAG: type II secretion system minor pseudopilin GspH [Methylococcaceae bacterium]|nr:type II secretion system minor pseudopilin GspH [Methylococcaceae bacterium]